VPCAAAAAPLHAYGSPPARASVGSSPRSVSSCRIPRCSLQVFLKFPLSLLQTGEVCELPGRGRLLGGAVPVFGKPVMNVYLSPVCPTLFLRRRDE
jgi:hypothetical protein